MQYREVEGSDRQALVDAERSGDERAWVDTMLSNARYSVDGKWIESYLLIQLNNPSIIVKWGAIKALAELARRRMLGEVDAVTSRLRELSLSPDVKAAAEDAIEDIQIYMNP